MSNLNKHSRRHRRARPVHSARSVLLTCIFIFAAVLVGCLLLLSTKKGRADAAAPEPSADVLPSDTPDEQPPELPDEQASNADTDGAAARIAEVIATMSENCTKDAPQVTDPSTWNEAGKALLETYEADPYYQEGGITLNAADGFPYLVAVNRAASTATVYTTDAENRYTVPFAAFVCSGGEDTPRGYFNTPISYQWRLLSGPCYGQYATRIWDSYLFHSVPYYTQHKDDLEYDQFNLLGTPASLGCIRLQVCDVKWIFDNCPIGTPVIIYDDAENPGPMGKPGTIYTDPGDEALRGWDPTDPDPANPWDDKFLSGTAIRSSAALQQWNDAMADGRWNNDINPTDLQGHSTDSTIEGTRG